MRRGLNKTEGVLGRTRNRAVLPLLSAAVRSTSAETQAAAIRAAIRRRDIESHTQLIQQFHELSDLARAEFREAHCAMPHHAAPAIKKAVIDGDDVLCRNACEIILLCRDHDSVQTLTRAVEKRGYHHATQVAAAILKLAQMVHAEFLERTPAERDDHDPAFARHKLIATLERTLKLKLDYCPPDIVDAFLLLAPDDNRVLHDIMRDEQHPSHSHLTASLARNNTRPIMQRLVAMLRDADAPAAALQAIAQRTDRAFTEFLLTELKHPVPLRTVQNMKRLRSITWLEQNLEGLLEMSGRAQEVAVELAVASGIDRPAQLRLLKLFLQQGLGEGRRASCQALAAFDSDEATDLVLAALRDPDGAVQAAAVRQLRPRRIPNALQLLVERLDSPFAEVRDAAKSSLAEFNFTRYRAMFDLLDEQAVRTTGVLVRQVDPTARQQLAEELSSPSTSTRLRAIEMTVAMSAVDDMRESLIAMAGHENAAVRKEAIVALSRANGANVLEAIKRATTDKNRSVADAARQTLAKFHEVVNMPPATTPAGAAR